MFQLAQRFLQGFVLSACCVSPALAAAIIVDFTSLPSGQGWTYESFGNSAPETSVFSVSGGVLTQNTMGLGFASQGQNMYLLSDVVDDTDPFQLIVRARVLQSEGNVATNPGGFSFGVYISNDAYLVALSPTQVQGVNQAFVADVDNTQFHTYEMIGTPGVGFTFYVDGVPIGGASALPIGPPTNGLQLGDQTGGTNALAEVTRYEFRQGASAVPEPSGIALAGLGLLLAVSACRGLGHRVPQRPSLRSR